MKIRSGFVSNSSSSSFMIGIGVITDTEKFKKWKAEIGTDECDLEIINPHEEVAKDYGSLSENIDCWYCDAPINDGYQDISIDKKEYNKLITGIAEDIAVLLIGNNEGDSAFYDDVDSDWPEIDHNIDFSWFSDEQQKIFEGFNEYNGLSLVDKVWGAGRNG